MKSYMKPAFRMFSLSANDLVPGFCQGNEDFVTIFTTLLGVDELPSSYFSVGENCQDTVDALCMQFGLEVACKFESENALFIS